MKIPNKLGSNLQGVKTTMTSGSKSDPV